MALYYPESTCGGGAIPSYACNPCPTFEYGRVRSIAFIKNTFAFVDPTSSTEWTAGIANGNIIVIWKTQGSYDGGSTQELTGFGDQISVNGNTTHILTVKDPNYKDNCDFYNSIKSSSDYTVAFRTSSQVHFANAPVTITPKNAVADDINSVVTWEAVIKWTNPDSPCPFTTPAGIFDKCYIV